MDVLGVSSAVDYQYDCQIGHANCNGEEEHKGRLERASDTHAVVLGACAIAQR